MASRPRSTVRVAAAAATLAMAIAGCGDDGPAPAGDPAAATDPPSSAVPVSSSPSTAPIDAEAYQVRTDEAIGGQFQVQLVNNGEQPFTVMGVRLDSAGFAALPFLDKDTTFGPGQRTDLTTPYGAVACDDGTLVEPAAAELRVVWTDGREEELRVPFASTDVLDRIHRRECDAAAFAASVDMHLGPLEVVERDDGTAVSTVLVLERKASDEAVVVEDTRGSVLITPSLTGTGSRQLAAGAGRVEIPYQLEVASCLPHLLADVKKPFDFTVYVRVGGAPTQAVALQTSDAERDWLWDYLLDYCA